MGLRVGRHRTRRPDDREGTKLASESSILVRIINIECQACPAWSGKRFSKKEVSNYLLYCDCKSFGLMLPVVRRQILQPSA